MGRCCARCMRFGEWKNYRGKRKYKGKPLCGTCKIVLSSKNSKGRKKTTSPGKAREKYLEEVKWRQSR